ncbi:hypothetical protein HELRODRAFT_182184 [Helobdella robusta]|uniref:Apple domain-containing protein n=1 Tax=Helobdella robusta TaxID=6412 RepID=T1FHW2_HELRO|nr:hypothetical protein HELRODRAFT_182184 [Helobdella robusta]ESN91212.1 hypothetical protein HELRODRAFT_182184 [Helobdella robusta]
MGNDGNYNQSALCYFYVMTGDPTHGENWWMVDLVEKFFIDRVVVYSTAAYSDHLSQFIIGLSNLFTPVKRNFYEICDQYLLSVVTISSFEVRCYANLPEFKVVVLQQPYNGPGTLSFAEVEVYASRNPNSKLWYRQTNYRMLKPAALKKTPSPLLECLIQCVTQNCNTINYNRKLKTNIALHKNATTDVYYGDLDCNGPWHATDGSYDNNRINCYCYFGGGWGLTAWLMVDLEEEFNIDSITLYTENIYWYKMHQFITGGSNNKTTVRGSYYICNQYEFELTRPSVCPVKCNANIPAVRYVIVQQRKDMTLHLNACELEIYAAKVNSSKLWNKQSDRRLVKWTPYTYNRTSAHLCLINCIQLNCDSVNYNNLTNACEIFQHPFGYYEGNLPTFAKSWDYWQLFYA